MFTHNLDPVLLEIGFIVIRWYSLAYILGILIGWWLGKKIINHILKNFNLTFDLKEFDDFITYLIISLILGGRIGYILFYNLEYFISNPFDAIKVWEGGMSFHGALLGIIIVKHQRQGTIFINKLLIEYDFLKNEKKEKKKIKKKKNNKKN